MSNGPHLAVVAPTEESAIPQQMLRDVMMFKSVFALCDISGNTLSTTHYTCCLNAGRDPIWGIWTKRGKFLRFATKKTGVEAAYPKKAWRRVQTSWNIGTMFQQDDPVDIPKQLTTFYK